MSTDDAKQHKSLIRVLFIQFFIFIIATLGFIPLIIFAYTVYYVFNPHLLLHWILLPVFIYFASIILLVSQYLISGIFISVFNIKTVVFVSYHTLISIFLKMKTGADHFLSFTKKHVSSFA